MTQPSITGPTPGTFFIPRNVDVVLTAHAPLTAGQVVSLAEDLDGTTDAVTVVDTCAGGNCGIIGVALEDVARVPLLHVAYESTQAFLLGDLRWGRPPGGRLVYTDRLSYRRQQGRRIGARGG